MTSTINLLRLLADSTRLRLLLLLEQEELSVAELQQILGMGQSRISSHLAQLKRAGIVEDRRSGKNVYYGGTRTAGRNGSHGRVREMIEILARDIPETARDRIALKLALRKRQDKAREYFDELAGKFGRSYVPGRSWKARRSYARRPRRASAWTRSRPSSRGSATPSSPGTIPASSGWRSTDRSRWPAMGRW